MDLDYLSASDGTGNAVLAHVTAPRLTGSTTLVVDSVDNWPEKFICAVGTLKSNGLIDLSTVTEFYGHITDGDIIIEDFEPGFTDNGNTVGQVAVVRPSTGFANKLIEKVSVSLNPDGTLKAGAVTNAALAGEISQDKILTNTLGYAEITSSFTSTSTTFVDVTGVAVTVNVPEGSRRLKITIGSAYIQTSNASAATSLAMFIKEGGTFLNSQTNTSGGAGYAHTLTVIHSFVPTAGTHTYKMVAKQDGAGTLTVAASATAPAFILVELI